MILEIFFPLLILVGFSYSDFKIGGVKFIFLLTFIFISLLINFFIIHINITLFFVSASIGYIMYISGNWGSADGYVLFGLTPFLNQFYNEFLLTLVFMAIMSTILSLFIEFIIKKENLTYPYIPFMSLGFLYVLPKLIVHNMG